MRAGWTGRVGLLFAALAGAGAASLVGTGLRMLPGVAAFAEQHPNLLIWAPLPFGALVAIGHLFWARGLQMARPAAAPQALSRPQPRPVVAPAGSLRAQVEAAKAAEGDAAPPRWTPDIRS